MPKIKPIRLSKIVEFSEIFEKNNNSKPQCDDRFIWIDWEWVCVGNHQYTYNIQLNAVFGFDAYVKVNFVKLILSEVDSISSIYDEKQIKIK